jgi:hypothetical protein
MILANLGLFVVIGASAVGSHDHRGPKPPSCDECGAKSAAVRKEIQILRTSRKKGDREDAAEDLRKFDWRRHPEAVLALCDALVLDPSDDVREEAAESLGKMAPCVPAAHEALSRAASRDPDHGVRKEARKAMTAMTAMGRRCIADCQVCGPLPDSSVIQGPTIIPPDWMPILSPGPFARPVPTPTPAEEPQLEPLPPTLPNVSPLPDVPPPPPTPVRLEGQVGAKAKVRRPGSVTSTIR